VLGGVVWYSGQFWALHFLQQVTKVDAPTTPEQPGGERDAGLCPFSVADAMLPCRISATNCETLARFSPQTAKPEIFAAKYA
jgi:hypothetical protein